MKIELLMFGEWVSVMLCVWENSIASTILALTNATLFVVLSHNRKKLEVGAL